MCDFEGTTAWLDCNGRWLALLLCIVAQAQHVLQSAVQQVGLCLPVQLTVKQCLGGLLRAGVGLCTSVSAWVAPMAHMAAESRAWLTCPS